MHPGVLEDDFEEEEENARIDVLDNGVDDGKYYCHGRSPTRKKNRDKRCCSHRYMSRD
ncbi:conserved hypothetical protein [Ricinus communis]|uniref:Uncharacterized protein n=1 Tax=Ricinus communis TaxID=3988 RepID=B9S0Z9_RICCO|nr:conserved hypothetical protein [Ricinus communis]